MLSGVLVILALMFSARSSRAASFLEPHERTRQSWLERTSRPQAGEKWMAIVGDSSVTGAVTSSAYTADWWNLLIQLFEFGLESQRTGLTPRFRDFPNPDEFNITNPVWPMTRVLYSREEFDEAKKKGEVKKLNLTAKASIRLDTPEYAFGYMIGRALNMQPAHIVMVGQDGARIGSMSTQFSRIFEIGSSTLPPLVLVSYVANDFCHPDNFKRSVSEFEAEYKASADRQFRQILDFPPDPRGTLILILAPLDVAQILTSPALLAQKITFQDYGKLTCGDLRHKQLRGYWAKLMEKRLVEECQGVLAPGHLLQKAERVREMQHAQVEALADAVIEFNREARSGLRAELARSVRSIRFETGDLAADCFHPGISGHARIAAQLLSHELRNW